ncbi:MAG: alpha-2-macroglobulin family protein [Myxococcales bacterium]
MSARRRRLITLAVALSAACAKESPSVNLEAQRASAPARDLGLAEEPEEVPAPMEPQVGGGKFPEADRGYDPAAGGGALADALGVSVARSPGANKASPTSEVEQAAQTRSWFPESFLFEPLLVTNDQGLASLSVRVPDRLTSWRVLALAHARNGAQGGAVTSFLGTLPVYVDPVVPETLVVGDEITIPIQLVNTTNQAVTTSFAVEISGASIDARSGTRTLPAGGSQVEYARLRVERPGEVRLRVLLGQNDAVSRSLKVVPSGRPVFTTRSGTLAAPRTLQLPATAGADPATDHVRLSVFPGALALLRSEMKSALSRAGEVDDAYALLLAARAQRLFGALGAKVDPDALRELSLVATQRAVRAGRQLDVAKAVSLCEAALGPSEQAVLQRLGQRAAEFLAQKQLPDGTFAGPNGRTLQQVLVEAADAVRAVAAASGTPEDERRTRAMSARALSAFGRHLDHVEDGYTAAAMLAAGRASGQVSGELAETLRTRLVASIKRADDGSQYLDVAEGVTRADGVRPSRVEATALAVLALTEQDKPLLADLGATLLGSYGLERGWGDGRANMLALQAVLMLFKEPMASDVRITLSMDGKPVLEGLLNRDKLQEVLTLEAPAPGLAAAHEWTLVAEPAVPGLGYGLTLGSYVPWQSAASASGLELSVPDVVRTSVGAVTPITLRAAVPAGFPVHVRHALPVGVQADPLSLEELVAAGSIERFSVMDGAVDLVAGALQPGQVFNITYRAVATFAGSLRSGASTLEVAEAHVLVPPSTWSVRAAGAASR